MEKDRQAKIIAIVVLFIGVVTLTLGFAAFSSKLIIQSKAKVTPDADSFKVVFSTEKTQETVGTIKPTGNGENATIDNTGDNPTISNLKANFTKPGQRVEYEFYAVNTGNLDAYLNKIEYANVASSTEKKVCTAGEGTTQALATAACNDIRITVQVEDDDKACETSTFYGHKLGKKVGEKVLVTIEYSKTGAMADGPFEVEFGDVTLNYSATDSETKSVPTCTDYETQIAARPMDTVGKTNITDADGDGKISKSDKVTLGTESFYVMSTDERAGTVTMLAEWNLNVGENTVSGTLGMQNEACKGWTESGTYYCILAFSSTNYWSSSVSTYPAWIYNENNDSVRPHVENYVSELKKLGYSSVNGRLIQYEELVMLGCADGGGSRTCNSAPTWIKNTTYWSGSASSSNSVWNVRASGTLTNDTYSHSSYWGIRPVITINAAEI